MSKILYERAGNDAEPSDVIWKDFPAQDAICNPGSYIHVWDDFIYNFTADEVMPGGNFLVVGTNPDTAVVTDEGNGVINISGSGAGDDEAYLVSNLLCDEIIKKNSGKRLWFEARIKFEDADADTTFLCGLGESSLLAADALANEGASRNNIADYDFIGFHTDNDGTNMGNMESCYHQDGDSGVVTAVQAAVITNSGTTYDDDYLKLGFRFDGKKTVTFYLDGAALGTTLDIDDLTGDKLDDPLGIIIGIKDLAGGTDDLKVDWVRYAHEKSAYGG